jgi:translocation and assembly module TamA
VLRIEPGPATEVASLQLEFAGDVAESADEDALALRSAIAREWPLKPGRRFTQAAWDEAKMQALRQLLARRYPAGRLSDSRAEVDTESHRVHLRVQLDSGPLYRLGPLALSGLSRYDPVLVPRLARLSPGQVYDQRQLVEAQQRLVTSGYFDAAYLWLDTAGDPASAPVAVQLREAARQKLVLGLGFATDSGPRLSAEHVHNRVPWLGWRAQSKLQLDGRSPAAQTEWTSLPDASLWRWVTALRLERLDDGALNTDTQRWRAGRLQPGEHIDRHIYLQYDRSELSGVLPEATPGASGEAASLSLNVAWTRRAFDSLPFPHQGQALSAELGAGSTLSAQRQPYARAWVRWTGRFPLGNDEATPRALQGRLALRLEGGAVGASSQAQVPGAQLFRAGGDTSVRGYGLREIGVPLPGGTVGPGRYLGAGSIEWQQPLRRAGVPTAWEGTLFMDAGDVAESAHQLGRRLAVGVGTGLRWKSPIGPLQVDLAYGLKSQQLRLHLSVGWVF